MTGPAAMTLLETPRLLIRPFTSADADDAHRLLDVDLQWSGPTISLDQRREKLRFQIELSEWSDARCAYGDRAVVRRDGNELIGMCGFRPWLLTASERALFEAVEPGASERSTLELGIGYAVASEHRGHGYATEAAQALIAHAFTVLRVARVVALAERGNAASVAVMRRIGMRIGINPTPEAVYPWAVGLIRNGQPGD